MNISHVSTYQSHCYFGKETETKNKKQTDINGYKTLKSPLIIPALVVSCLLSTQGTFQTSLSLSLFLKFAAQNTKYSLTLWWQNL